MNPLSTTWSSAAPALGNHLWQSTLFAAVAALLALTLRNYQARTRYWLWLAASAKFLIPFSLLLSIGSHLAWSLHPATSQPAMYAAIDQISQPFTDTVIPNTPIVPTAHPSTLLPTALATLWLCGFIAVLVFWSIQLRRVAKSVRGAKPLQSGREIEILRRLEQTANLQSPIELRTSHNSMEPGVVGILHPVLLWPEGISQHLDDAHLEAILAHEVCHVQRRDNLTSTIHMLVEALFWFHPLVWWLEKRLINERERACDEAVLQLVKQPKIYAESILKVCEFCVESPLTCVSGITGADLKKRIVQIMTDPTVRKLDLGKKLLLAAVGLVAVAGPVAFGVMHVVPLNAIEAERSEMLASAQATSAKSIEFDVASIKENRSAPGDMSWGCKGTDGKTLSEVKNHSLNLAGYGDIPLNSCVVRNTPMQWIIGLAYQMPWDKVNQLIMGGPSWLSSGLDSPLRFDINAKVEQPATRAQLFLMLQTLLADRFQLKIHEDYKELPVFELTIAKNGPRLTKAPTDRDCSVVVEPEVPCHNFSGGFGHGLTGRSVSMEDFAVRLSRYTGRPVVDKTGLDGLYDIKTGDFWMPFPDTPDPGTPTLFEMLDQLGIKLKAAKAPVKVLVVDSAQEPSPN
jgi:bla regulator protein blaR1